MNCLPCDEGSFDFYNFRPPESTSGHVSGAAFCAAQSKDRIDMKNTTLDNAVLRLRSSKGARHSARDEGHILIKS